MAAPESPTSNGGFTLESPLRRSRSVDLSEAAEQKRKEAIEALQEIIVDASDQQKPEMVFRLADLYWGQARYHYTREMLLFEEAYQRWSAKGAQGPPPEKRSFTRESMVIEANAIELYQRILNNYPDYSRRDEVWFVLGQIESSRGQHDLAKAMYKNLVQGEPRSNLVASAYLQLGEIYFQDNDLPQARTAYQQATLSNESQVANYALYKLAWCDYNLGNYSKGIDRLQQVIQSSTLSDGGKELRSEVLADLTRFYAQIGSVEKALSYFKQVAGVDAVKYGELVSDMYFSQGRWRLSIECSQELQAHFPQSKKLAHYQLNKIKAYRQLEDFEAVGKSAQALVKLFHRRGPWNRQGGAENKSLEAEFREVLIKLELGTQNKRGKQYLNMSRVLYQAYLDMFPYADWSLQARFYYAETHWALEQWDAAATAYQQVAEAEPNPRLDIKLVRAAALNQILALEKVEKAHTADEGEQGISPNEERTKRLVGTRVQDQLVKACDRYIELADSEDSELASISFKAAYIYYERKILEEAHQRFLHIVNTWPSTSLAQEAAQIVLDIDSSQERWDEVKKWSHAFLNTPELTAKSESFQEYLERAAYIQIKTKEKRSTGSLVSTAHQFQQFQKDYPQSALAGRALLSAVVLYQKLPQLDLAIEVAETFQKNYAQRYTKDAKSVGQTMSNREVAQRVHLLLAELYEQMARFRAAADTFRSFYTEYPGHTKAANALFNAGVYYESLGQIDKAIASFKVYRDKTSPPDASEISSRICGLYTKLAQWLNAKRCYIQAHKQYSDKSEETAFLINYHIIKTSIELGEKKSIYPRFQSLLSAYKRLSDSVKTRPLVRKAAAHAAYAGLDPEFRRYERLQITLRRQSLAEKIGAAERLACVGEQCVRPGKLLSVLAYEDAEYGICALTRIGQVYRGLADGIRKAPVPQGLDADQLDIYQTELDKVASGPANKGIEAFQEALKKASELGVYGDCLLIAQTGLSEMQGKEIPPNYSTSFKYSIPDVKTGPRLTRKEL